MVFWIEFIFNLSSYLIKFEAQWRILLIAVAFVKVIYYTFVLEVKNFWHLLILPILIFNAIANPENWIYVKNFFNLIF